MKPEIKWISDFDLNINIGDRQLQVPGNEIHAKLKYHENRVRTRQSNIEAILSYEHQYEQAKKRLKELVSLDRNELNQRIYALSVDLIRYVFESKSRSEYTRKFYVLLISGLEQKIVATGWYVDINGFLQYNDTYRSSFQSYIQCFENKQFGPENQFITNFLNLISLNIFIETVNSATALYGQETKISTSSGKRKEIEQKVAVLLEEFQKSQPNYLGRIEEEIKQLQVELDKLRSQTSCENVKENIVIGHVGFIVEVKSSSNDPESALQFIHFPIIGGVKNIHTVYDQFKDTYNYRDRTSDGKKIKRNSLIDQQLSDQVSEKKFNKQLDYHSERDLYLCMQDPSFMRYLIKNLKQSLGGKHLYKIHLVVLDMHSSRYMCNRCQEATAFMQRPNGPFLTHLASFLKKEFANTKIISELSLRLMTRVSADIEFQIPKVTAPSHTHEVKTLTENTILAMDTTSIQLQSVHFVNRLARFKNSLHRYTLFASSENNDPTKNLILAYNDTVEPIKNEAAKKIQRVWQQFRRRKRQLIEQEGIQKDSEYKLLTNNVK